MQALRKPCSLTISVERRQITSVSMTRIWGASSHHKLQLARTEALNRSSGMPPTEPSGDGRRVSRSNTFRITAETVTYALFGALGLNWRASTLATIGRSCLLSVVWTNLRFQSGFKLAWRIKRRTLKRPDHDAAIQQFSHHTAAAIASMTCHEKLHVHGHSFCKPSAR